MGTRYALVLSQHLNLTPIYSIMLLGLAGAQLVAPA